MRLKLLVIQCLMMVVFNVRAQEFKSADPKDIALFPQQNINRNLLDLSGIWKFKKDSLHIGENEGWFNGLQKSQSIAVPGSWNEQLNDLRDYLDVVWYETETYIPQDWKDKNIFIRVGSAVYYAKLWVNGKPLGFHEGGHSPFVFSLNNHIKWNEKNRITIQIENVLKPDRIPTGNSNGSFNSFPKANYDFFPYAGLNRPVYLYSVPKKAYINDITVIPDFEGTNGHLNIIVEQKGNVKKGLISISGNGKVYEQGISFQDGIANAKINIPNVRLWSIEDPFLYQVKVVIKDGGIIDSYELDAGVRTVSVSNKSVLLNGKPVYLKGFGKHEDFPIFGRGTANPVMIKDFELMKWTGANSIRTSHYPYDEEFYRTADKIGFLIIDEIPNVGMFFDDSAENIEKRRQISLDMLKELHIRDKNHPSVIMWSVANEPSPYAKISTDKRNEDDQPTAIGKEKLGELIRTMKSWDPSRPSIFVGVMGGPSSWFEISDIIAINRYYGWYTHTGDLKGGVKMLGMEMDGLYKRFQKPIMVSEFGADTYPGMHSDQLEMFTEEFQKEFIKSYLELADTKDFVTGMHVWNFADFKTGQGLIRFGGYNYKGVFTRDRRPKMAAHYLREKWTKKENKK